MPYITSGSVLQISCHETQGITIWPTKYLQIHVFICEYGKKVLYRSTEGLGILNWFLIEIDNDLKDCQNAIVQNQCGTLTTELSQHGKHRGSSRSICLI